MYIMLKLCSHVSQISSSFTYNSLDSEPSKIYAHITTIYILFLMSHCRFDIALVINNKDIESFYIIPPFTTAIIYYVISWNVIRTMVSGGGI